MATEFSD